MCGQAGPRCIGTQPSQPRSCVMSVAAWQKRSLYDVSLQFIVVRFPSALLSSAKLAFFWLIGPLASSQPGSGSSRRAAASNLRAGTPSALPPPCWPSSLSSFVDQAVCF